MSTVSSNDLCNLNTKRGHTRRVRRFLARVDRPKPRHAFPFLPLPTEWAASDTRRAGSLLLVTKNDHGVTVLAKGQAHRPRVPSPRNRSTRFFARTIEPQLDASRTPHLSSADARESWRDPPLPADQDPTDDTRPAKSEHLLVDLGAFHRQDRLATRKLLSVGPLDRPLRCATCLAANHRVSL